MIRIFNVISIALVAILLTAGMAISESPKSDPSKRPTIRYTGNHGRNVRVTIEGGEAVIVKGTIFEVRGSTIIMDGESFSLTGAEIKDQAGIERKPRQLYPGLKVHLLLRHGSVVKVSIKNFTHHTTRPDQVDPHGGGRKPVEKRQPQGGTR